MGKCCCEPTEEEIAKAKDKAMLREFLKADNLNKIREEAGTQGCVVWQTLLGETFKEKYHSIYTKLVEFTNVAIRKGAKGYFWIVTSPEIGSLFECATATFAPYPWEDGNYGGQIRMGADDTQYLGLLNRRWRVYVASIWPVDSIMIGAGWDRDTFDPRHAATMRIDGFVI